MRSSTSARLGYYEDKDLATYYLRARIYDPLTGRFLSPDPVGLDNRGIGLYLYALNNPVNSIDPSGLAIWIPIAAGCVLWLA